MMNKHQGLFHDLRDLLINADLHTDYKGSEYYEIDAHELQKTLAALDAFLADVPEGLGAAQYEMDVTGLVPPDRRDVLFKAAKLLQEATQEKPQ